MAYTPPWEIAAQRRKRQAQAGGGSSYPSADNGGGWGGLGLGNLLEMPGKFVQGIGQLGVGMVTNPGDTTQNFAEGVGRSFLSTADTVTGGLAHKPLATLGGGDQYVQPAWNRRGGILPALVEDTLNASIIASGGESAFMSSARAADEAAATAAAAGDTVGAEAAAARAATARASAARAHVVAHPFKSAYTKIIRPYAQAGEATKLAAASVVTKPTAEAASIAEAQGPGGSYGRDILAGVEDTPVRQAAQVHPEVQAYHDQYGTQHGLEQPTPVDTSLPDLSPAARQTMADTYNHPDFATPNDPATQASYQALANERDAQYDFLTRPRDQGGLGIRVEVVADNNHAQPYATAQEMFNDIEQNGRMKINNTGPGEEHPLWTPEENNRFRAIHDYFGHRENLNDFSRHGEEIAYQAHARMFSPEARRALATETRGQNAALITSKIDAEAAAAAGEIDAQRAATTGLSPLEQASADAAAHAEATAPPPAAANESLLASRPPEPEAPVTLYRGEPAGGAATNPLFHTEESYARNYAGADGVVKQVTVPESVARQASHPDTLAEYGRVTNQPTPTSGSAVLPNEWADVAYQAPTAAAPVEGTFAPQKLGLMPERMADPLYGHTTYTSTADPVAVGERELIADETKANAEAAVRNPEAGGSPMIPKDAFEQGREIMRQRAEAIAAEGSKPRGRVGTFVFGKQLPGEEALPLHTRLLAGVEERLLAHEVRTELRTTERAAQTAARAANNSPIVRATLDAAALHILPLVDGDVVKATRIAGDEITARLTGIHEWQQALGMSDETAVARGVRQEVLPPGLRDNPAFEADIAYATDLWKRQRIDAFRTIQESRLGNKGLPLALDDTQPILTKAEQRMFRKAQSESGRALRMEPAVMRERMKAEGKVASDNDTLGKLGERLGRIQDAQEAIKGTFDASRSGLPAIWGAGEKAVASWAERRAALIAMLNDPENPGFSWDPHTDSLVVAPNEHGRYVVSILPGVEGIPKAAVTPELLDGIAKHYQAMFDGHANVVLGGWVDDAGKVYIEPSEIVRSRSDAVRLGNARAQDSVYDLGAKRPEDAFISTEYVGRPDISGAFIKNHTFRDRRAQQLYAAVESGKLKNLTAPQIDQIMALQDSIAVQWAKTHGDISPDSYFKRFEYQARVKQPKSLPTTGVLAQNVMQLEPGMPLYHEIVNAGYDVDKMLPWYYRSHAAIEKWGRGRTVTLLNGHQMDAADLAYELLAITSVSASPATNLGNTLTGIANIKRFLAGSGTHIDALKEMIDEFDQTPMKRGSAQAPSLRAGTRLFKHLAKDTHMYTSSQYGVFEILSGHTIHPYDGWDGWTNDYVRSRGELFGGNAKRLSAKHVTSQMVDDMIPMAEAQIKAGAKGTVDEIAHELAVREYHGSEALAKILSFHDNLANPETSMGVTLDSWMGRGFGEADTHVWDRVGNYHAFAEKVRTMADDMSAELGRDVKPHEVQALLWGYIKSEISRQNVGIALAHGSDLIESIRDGSWTPQNDPWQAYLDLNADPMRERLASLEAKAKERPPTVERQVPVVRGAQTAEHAAALVPETERYLTQVTESASEIKDYLAAVDSHRSWQRDIEAMLAEGDKTGALEEAHKLVNEEAAAVRDEDWRDFADIMADPTPKVRDAIDALDPYGLGLPQVLASTLHEKVLGLTILGGETDKMIVRLFQDADFSTLVHENAHVLRQIMSPEDLSRLERAYGIEGGKWTRQHEERFANDFVGYLASGHAPGSHWLTPIYEQLRQVLNQFWQYTKDGFAGNRAGINIPQGTRELLDTYLNPEQLPTELTPGFKAREIPPEPRMLGKEAQTPPEVPGATPRQMYARGVTSGKAAERFAESERRMDTIIKQRAQLVRQRDTLKQSIIDGTLPRAQRQAMLQASAKRTLERFMDSAEMPSVARVPAQWQPLWKATKDLIDEGKDNPALAAALDDLPQTFTAMIARAEELGIDPVHVRNFTQKQAEQLVYGSMRLGRPNTPLGKEVEAGTRKARVLSDKTGYRSIESLVAAVNEVTWEARTNGVVDMVEKQWAREVGPDGVIPDGWVPWGPRRAGLVSVDPATAERSIQAGDLIIPKTVDGVLRRWTKDYAHPTLTAASKITNPWKTLVLTLSPRWYVHRVFGNIVMAAVDGARLQDFVKAWRGYKAAELPEGIHGNTFVDTGGERSLFPPTKGIAGVKEAFNKRGVTGAFTHTTTSLGASHAVIDEVARAAVYFKNIRKNMPPPQALDAVYKALVDYNDLSPFERQVVKAVVPFYPWIKGLMKIGARFPIDHPQMTAIAFYLDRLNQDLQVQQFGVVLPHGYQTVMNIPLLGAVNTRIFNPLMGAGTLVTPEGIAQSINPFLDIGIRAGLDAPRPGTAKPGIGEFGQRVEKVDPLKALAGIGIGLPQSQAVFPSGQGADQLHNTAKFLGLPLMPDSQIKALSARTQATLGHPTALGAGSRAKRKPRAATVHTAPLRASRLVLPKIKGVRRSNFRRSIGVTSTASLLKGIRRYKPKKVKVTTKRSRTGVR